MTHRSFILLVLALAAAPAAPAQTRVSTPGVYEGYSAAEYDGWKRTAQYLTMRDGVRIAIDIYRPTRKGVLHDQPLPVVWSHVRYHRSDIKADTLVPFFSTFGRGSEDLIKHGYVVASVDTRGGGASFGNQQGFFHPDETKDAYEVTEWLAKQPWSTGKIGMIGRSYLGITQYFAASQKPPHLKAIFPEMAVYEWYPFIYPGGIYRDDFFQSWQKLTYTLDRSDTLSWFVRKLGPVSFVDGGAGKAQRDSAIAGHAKNRNIFEMWRSVPFRNSVDPVSGKALFAEREPAAKLAEINRSGVAIYTLAGWYDAFPRDALLWQVNLTVPHKLIVGPWFHGQTDGFDLGIERVRWYDYWLKGIDNGIMREPSIRYYVMGAPKGSEWRTSKVWPLPEARNTTFYFAAGPAGIRGGANDGSLVRAAPKAPGHDSLRVDQSATVGPGTRWSATYGGNNGYPDLAPNDRKGFTYTTAPLDAAALVIGHPVVHLWVESSAPDADFFVYLEEVDPSGKSSYVTEGALRASHRLLAPAPFKNLSLPWPRSFDRDVAALPQGGPTELIFDLHPTAQRFQKGNRIRVTVTNADRDTHKNPYPAAAPIVSLYRNPIQASRIVLPMVKP